MKYNQYLGLQNIILVKDSTIYDFQINLLTTNKSANGTKVCFLCYLILYNYKELKLKWL